MFSGLPKGQMPVFMTGKENLYTQQGRFAVLALPNSGRKDVVQNARQQRIALLPYTIKIANAAGTFSGLPKRANAGPL